MQAFELCLLARTCAVTGNFAAGQIYKSELLSLISNTMRYLACETTEAGGDAFAKIKQAWNELTTTTTSVFGPLLRGEPTTFFACLREAADICVLYDDLPTADSYMEM